MKRKIAYMMALCATVFAAAAGPVLKVCPGETVDFGKFEEDEIQTREIYIKNEGDEPLMILKTFTSCSCTKLKFDNKEIAPGDSLPVTVIFDVKGWHPGPVRKVTRITSNAENPIVGLLIKGQIVAPFQK